MRKRKLGKDEKREVTPEFVNMRKEILYPKFRVLQWDTGELARKGELEQRVRDTMEASLGQGRRSRHRSGLRCSTWGDGRRQPWRCAVAWEKRNPRAAERK
jgi:hypothetical protein